MTKGKTMLFLLNDHIVELDMPEAHLRQRWRSIGCGDPHTLRAQDAIEFVGSRVCEAMRKSAALSPEELKDYAALIIAKTGANSLMLKPKSNGGLEPRLQDLPKLVLETYQRGAANDQREGLAHAGT